MADYYEVSVVREDRNGQKRWTRLGVAFPFKNGKEGFSISLVAMPASVDGEYKLVITRPQPKDGQARQNRTQRDDNFEDSPF